MLSVIVHLSTRKMEQEILSLCMTLLRYLLVQSPGCLNNTILSNFGPNSARFICLDKLRATSVSHPSSHPISSLGFAGGKHLQKITIPIFRLVLQNVAAPPLLFSIAIFPLLSPGCLVIAVCSSISVRELSERLIFNCYRVVVSDDK